MGVATKNRISSNGDSEVLTKPAKKEKAVKESRGMTIMEPDLRFIQLKIVGETPLIVNKFSDKTKLQMAEKQAGRGQTRGFKDPQEDFKNSLHVISPGKYGFPAIAFKLAAVTACTSLNRSFTKTAAFQSFHVLGDLIEIKSKNGPRCREDMVRVGPQKSADIRYRGCFDEWYVMIKIHFNAHVISPPMLVNLFNIAGFGVGIGEWRVEKKGQSGRFHVESMEDDQRKFVK